MMDAMRRDATTTTGRGRRDRAKDLKHDAAARDAARDAARHGMDAKNDEGIMTDAREVS
jgi:hypothetical protein